MSWNIERQPVTHGDLASALSVSPARLARILDTHGVDPAYRIGRTRCYDRRQVDAIAELVSHAGGRDGTSAA